MDREESRAVTREDVSTWALAPGARAPPPPPPPAIGYGPLTAAAPVRAATVHDDRHADDVSNEGDEMRVRGDVVRGHDEEPARRGKRIRGKHLEEALLVPIADAVRLAGVVDGLAHAEQTRPALLLTPRAHYMHRCLIPSLEEPRVAITIAQQRSCHAANSMKSVSCPRRRRAASRYRKPIRQRNQHDFRCPIGGGVRSR